MLYFSVEISNCCMVNSKNKYHKKLGNGLILVEPRGELKRQEGVGLRKKHIGWGWLKNIGT